MAVRCYSLEERFVIFIKLFSDTWSGLTAVIETSASVKISVQFVDITCGAAAPNKLDLHIPTWPGQ